MSWFTRTLSFRNVEDDDRRQSAGARGNSNQSVSSAGRTFDNSSDADFLDHDHEHEHQPQPVNPPRQAVPRSTPPQSTRYSSPPTRPPSQRVPSPTRTPSQRITSPVLSRTPSQRQLSPRSRTPSTHLMSRSNSGNMSYSPNGQPPMRYSGSMQQPAPSNIFAPVVDPSTGATMAPMRGPMGSTLNRQASGNMMPMDYGSPMGGYGPNSPMPPSSGASVMLTPPMPRPASMNMGGGASVAPGMAMGMNNLSMNNMALGMNGGLNNLSMNNMNGMNPMGMSTLGINTLPNALSPMMPVGATPGGLSPMVMTPAGISPMAPVGTTGLGMMPTMSTMNMVGGVSPYGGVSTAGTAGLIPLNSATPAVLSPMLPSAGAVGAYNPLDPTGQMAYLSPVGRMSLNGTSTMTTTSSTATSSDPALELALRQSMVDSAPRWMTDRSYQAAREEAMKKQNDDMLERAIRQSLDETNLHRLRQDEIERSNRILQQSNDRALEEAIRASLQDYSHEDIQRAKSVDAIEQANEDALQRAILQSMQESGGGGGGAASSSLRATATMTTTTTTMTSSQRLAASSSSMGLTGGSPRAVPISRVNPPQPQPQQQQQAVRSPQPPPAGLARMNSANSANGAAFHQNQPYRPGPFPPEPPPQMPYYQVQYQQTLQQQQQYHPSDAYAYEDGGYDDAPQPPAPTNVSARSQMMMGMMMRHSYDDRDDGHGHGAAGDDYDDEYMQPASYANTPQQQQPYGPHTLRQQPSSQFISVGNGQGRSSGTGMRDPNNPNNDGETVVSSTSSGAGIGRNTAAQVTSLYLNNPDLIEQEMQQRYQRQYQLYLQQQLAQADVANQRLASTSQDAYDQIQQHHGSGGGSGKAPPQQQQSVARAVFEAAPDQPPTMYPGGGPLRQQSSQRQRISSQHQMSSQQQTPHDEDQDDNQTRNSSGNLSGGTGTSAARRLSQTQSFIGNPLMQSRISAVAHHQQQQHQQQPPQQPPQQQQPQPQPQQPMSQAAAGSLQSPNQAAFMEKLRRKSGSHGPTGGANDSVDGNVNGPANGGFSPYPDDSHRGSYPPQQQSPPPPGYDGPMTSSGKSQGASSLTTSTKSTSGGGGGGRSFHVPRASFHQFVDGVEVPTEAANGFNDAAFHPHGGHHQLGVHHEAPHRLSKHEVLVERDEYGIPLTVDEKHHPHLHQLKATLSQTQMSLSSDSDDDDDDDVHGKQLRPRVGSNGNMQRPSLTNIAVPAAAAFPTATPNGGKTMKKTFSAPKMIDTHNEDSPATTPVAAKATARPGLYDRNLVESVDLDPSKIKIQRKIIHHAAKPL